ncbi:MAG: hypothetical protein E7031_04100 [Akkermansiaceae bacterium]|nr:hypothetical protein [Akkermansiaceae bacterium]
MGSTGSIYNISKNISIGLRILIVGVGALLLMLIISYPSVLIAQEPYLTLPGLSQEFLLEWKNWLWVAPWLLMEIAAIAGPQRNFVWYCGLVGVMVLTMLAYPILQATRPELIHPHFYEWVYRMSLSEAAEDITLLAPNSPYRDKCLEFGFAIMWALLGLSIFLRTVVLGYLVKLNEVREVNEINNVDIADIDPKGENARTVKEIAETAQKVKADFKFGEADHGLVAHLRSILTRLQYLRTIKGLCWLGAALFVILWFFLYPLPNKEEALARDLAAMYETRLDDEGNEIGTTRAVYAALRVMQYAYDNKSLDYKTVAEAEKWLQLDRASDTYRQDIRNENAEELEYLPERIRSYQTPYPRARFLTISDGRHHAVMLLYLDETKSPDNSKAASLKPGTKIFFSDFFEFGWDNKQDVRRSYPYLEELYQFNNFTFM